MAAESHPPADQSGESGESGDSVRQHRRQAAASVRVAVLTISDTRTEESDVSGRLVRELVSAAGHEVTSYRVLKDEPQEVRAAILALCDAASADVVITNGGTGISRRDTTYEAVSGLLEQRLDGFGELFRSLSYQEIGSAAMLSRAVAGVCRGLFVFATPGSSGAVRLALDKLILPELGHLVGERRK